MSPDSSSKSRNRVLIVDDDPMILESLDMLFSYYGWDVQTASSGDQILAGNLHLDYQLALVDQRMNGADGLEVIRELKSHSSAPVFMLTGCVDLGLRQAAKKAGADRFFDKPVETRVLIDAVEEL